MPFYEEKFISPLAIRFSQARIRPTFQDGRCVEASRSEIQAAPWPLEAADGYDVLLRAPFPPIEIIRWTPKVREENGSKCKDDEGNLVCGDPCWFTFDNRRLYCLQAAAVAAWPMRAAAVVHVMMDLPLTRSAPRKFKTTDLGSSIRISRRDDAVPRSIWCWQDAVQTFRESDGAGEKAQVAQDRILEDVAKDSLNELRDVPTEGVQLKPTPANGGNGGNGSNGGSHNGSYGGAGNAAAAAQWNAVRQPAASRSYHGGGGSSARNGAGSTRGGYAQQQYRPVQHSRPSALDVQAAPPLSLERSLLVSPERSPSTASASTSAPSGSGPRTASRTASLGSNSPELAPALSAQTALAPPPLPSSALGSLPCFKLDDEEEDESNCETQ